MSHGVKADVTDVIEPRERDLYAAAAMLGKTPGDVLAAIVDTARPAGAQIAQRCHSVTP